MMMSMLTMMMTMMMSMLTMMMLMMMPHNSMLTQRDPASIRSSPGSGSNLEELGVTLSGYLWAQDRRKIEGWLSYCIASMDG